jgi:DNA-binding transcriptional MerR regulator
MKEIKDTGVKSAGAFRTIGEVADELGIAQHVLRFWEKKFTQLSPVKRRGRRYYRPEDVVLLTQIKALLYDRGVTIRGAQKFLGQRKHGLEDRADLFYESIAKASNQNGAGETSDTSADDSIEEEDRILLRSTDFDQPRPAADPTMPQRRVLTSPLMESEKQLDNAVDDLIQVRDHLFEALAEARKAFADVRKDKVDA